MAPTVADAALTERSGARGLVLATGITAVMLAAVMVVALTPPSSSAPTAVSATTLPAPTVQFRGAEAQSAGVTQTARDAGAVRIEGNTFSRDGSVAFVGSPLAVSAEPVVDATELDVANDLPAQSERVVLLTTSHTFRMAWSRVDDVIAPDGSVVIDRDGGLVALFVDGQLRVLVD